MYTPQFSDMASISVKRFSLAIGKRMTETVELMVKLLPTIVNPTKICQSCQVKDKGKYINKYKEKCNQCIFSKQVNPDDLAALEAVI